MLYSQGPGAVNTSYLVGIGDAECFKVSHLSYTTWCPVGGREREGEGSTGVGGQEVKLLSLKQVSYKDMLHSARNTVFY